MREDEWSYYWEECGLGNFMLKKEHGESFKERWNWRPLLDKACNIIILRRQAINHLGDNILLGTIELISSKCFVIVLMCVRYVVMDESQMVMLCNLFLSLMALASLLSRKRVSQFLHAN